METTSKGKRGPFESRFLLGAAIGIGILGVVSANVGPAAATPSTAPAASRYIGAKKCKNCHKSDEGGNQYAAWEAAEHSKAFEALGSPEAKEAAAALGIEDPQKADECLKCHVTAFGQDEKAIKKGFKVEAGVQCETCHGPGEDHMKARMKAAATAEEGATGPVEVGEGEIVASPSPEVCYGCHNEESPTFEGFCYAEAFAKIVHWDPRKPERELPKCPCGDPCPDSGKGCSKAGCGAPPEAAK